mmetsp:Transcript_43085/g.84247  ORF Transcript_43085/g.84247 Transcript_43085/m.84247 type:complete len:317 (+) Transcript_43085:866-1816(+)
MLAVQQHGHHLAALALRVLLVVPRNVLTRRLKVVPGPRGVDQPAVRGLSDLGSGGRHNLPNLRSIAVEQRGEEATSTLQHRHRAHVLLHGGGRGGGVGGGQAAKVFAHLAEHGDHVGEAACVPVRVGRQPASHVLGLVHRDEFQHLGTDLQERCVAVKAILLTLGAELSEQCLDCRRHTLLLARLRRHAEGPHLRRRHKLQRALEHKPVGHRRDAVPQPVDLVEVEDERSEEDIRPIQSSRELLWVAVDVCVGEDENLQPGALRDGLGGGLLVKLAVEGLEPGHQHDSEPLCPNSVLPKVPKSRPLRWLWCLRRIG